MPDGARSRLTARGSKLKMHEHRMVRDIHFDPAFVVGVQRLNPIVHRIENDSRNATSPRRGSERYRHRRDIQRLARILVPSPELGPIPKSDYKASVGTPNGDLADGLVRVFQFRLDRRPKNA